MAVLKERVRLSAEVVGSRETPTAIFAYGATHSRVAEAGMLCVGAEEGNSPFPLQREGESGARGDSGVCCSKEANNRRSGASSCYKFCIACSLCFFHFVPYFSRRLRLRVSGWKKLLKLTPKKSLRGIGSFSFFLFPFLWSSRYAAGSHDAGLDAMVEQFDRRKYFSDMSSGVDLNVGLER